jgi:DNA-binding IclR family transcriptional regulator
MGKVLLSSLDQKEVHEIINRYGWRKKTERSISNFKELDRELLKIRQKGYAVDIMENGENTCCLAMPILDQAGNVVAAISASTDPDSFERERKNMLNCIRKNAEETSNRMGYLGKYPVINVCKG